MSEETESGKTKLFISHASEDQKDFVEPLVEALESAGFDTWYAPVDLKLGQSILGRIGEGLRECDYGVVILSRSFFAKKWTQAEVEGLVALEEVERKLILPIWHGVSEKDVKEFSPILAGRLGFSSEHGVLSVVEEIKRSVQTVERAESLSGVDGILQEFADLNEDIENTRAAEKVESSGEGVQIVKNNAQQIVTDLREKIEKIGTLFGALPLKIKMDKYDGPETISIIGPYARIIVIHYGNNYDNVVRKGALRFGAYIGNDDSPFRKMDFNPRFCDDSHLLWEKKGGDERFTSEELSIYLLREIMEIYQDGHKAEKERQAR